MQFGNIHGLMNETVQAEVLPILAFFGLFAVIYFVGWPLFRHLPHKKDGMWNEMMQEIHAPAPEHTAQDEEGEEIVRTVSTEDLMPKEKERS